MAKKIKTNKCKKCGKFIGKGRHVCGAPKAKKAEEPIVIDPDNEEVDDETIISCLQALKEHPGWKIIKKILDTNVFEQEKKILNDLFEKDLKYNDEDLEKQIRRVYISIRDLPDREIERLSGGKIEEENYDPYFQKSTK